MYLSNKDLFELELLYVNLKNHADIIDVEKIETLGNIINNAGIPRRLFYLLYYEKTNYPRHGPLLGIP